ncbi:MAG: 2,3-bisphosphoglycerate-independent phosphoglycerate mutase [bacterium]|nr:2,3-bisphosphoglycerate-independent phosphoglycerate mutase [bacterium]
MSLKKLTAFTGRKGTLLLIIMDGMGIGKKDGSNAFHMAKTPNLDRLMQTDFSIQLKAHGKSVGLPSDDDMGNSEVGHNALGAGRIFSQGAKLVKQAVESGELFQGEVWQRLVDRCIKKDSIMHFIGLLSDGNVHSHIDNLLSLIREAADLNVKNVCVHILLDGRDVGARTSLSYISKLEVLLQEVNTSKGFNYRIASGGGRMTTTMDRYFSDWSIVQRGWDAHVRGKGRQFSSAKEAVTTFYSEDNSINDQYLPPFVINQEGSPVGKIQDGDSVVFFNFRGDRAIQISMAFEEEDFEGFDRVSRPDILYAGMMQYDGDKKIPADYLVSPPSIDHILGHYLCAEKVVSFAVSETQKFGHVTYFWNGNNSGYIDETLENYIEITSDRIQFDQIPEMKAYEITEKTIELLKSGKYRFGRLNFANGDMVGHTGNMEAAVRACEVVDECVGRLVEEVSSLDGITIITSDHGNSDVMYRLKDGEKEVVTSHTLNKVPFIIVDHNYNYEYRLADIDEPGLSNVAATICNILGYEKPEDYDSSLIDVVDH